MANTESKLWCLEQINILNNFTTAELAEVEKKSVLRAFDKKVNIYFPGDPANVVYLLKSGRVKIVTMGGNGKEIIKNILYPGEIFRELSIATGGEREDYAIALDKDVKLCTISYKEILEIMDKIPRLQYRITKTIGEKVVNMERKFNSLLFQSSEQRVVLFLIEMAAKIGTPVGTEISIKHNLSHEEIGNLTCTSRQTVTTVLNELKRKDEIYMERKKILIRNIQNLKRWMQTQ
ncbi:MAG: Crp/Fnr family transcriptional regulator [Flavobacteriales bacterium]|nr:Crp/Fnr family transcriptional regulator [Flavobacteriales bacterium]